MNKGDTVYLLPSGNATRYIEGDIIDNLVETKVVSKGRKYIGVSFNGLKFEIGSEWRGGIKEHTNYSADYYLYETKQQILDSIEKDDLYREIGRAFKYGNNERFTIEQLRKAYKILEL